MRFARYTLLRFAYFVAKTAVEANNSERKKKVRGRLVTMRNEIERSRYPNSARTCFERTIAIYIYIYRFVWISSNVPFQSNSPRYARSLKYSQSRECSCLTLDPLPPPPPSSRNSVRSPVLPQENRADGGVA